MEQSDNSPKRPAQAAVIWLTLMGAMGFSSCGKPEVELGDVHGKVTMDGRPLPNAIIRFVPVEAGRSAIGMTDAGGQYQMQYSAGASGSLVGEMRIEITTGNPDDLKAFPETVPSRFNLKSELKATVAPGQNEFNFDVKSK